MKLSLTGKHSRAMVSTEDTDPLDPVETEEIYNRYQTQDMEGYPEVTLHLGDPRPHAVQSGIDTFYGMDHQQPQQSERAGDTDRDAPSGVEAVQDGLDQMRREAEAETAEHRVRVNTNASGDWSATTFAIDSTQGRLIANDRANRGDVVVTNWSTSDVYVSHHNPPDVTGGATPDVVKVAANGGTRTVRTQREIWCRGTTTAAQVVDVQAEYN